VTHIGNLRRLQILNAFDVGQILEVVEPVAAVQRLALCEALVEDDACSADSKIEWCIVCYFLIGIFLGVDLCDRFSVPLGGLVGIPSIVK
jgi:hypothetical protein